MYVDVSTQSPRGNLKHHYRLGENENKKYFIEILMDYLNI